MQYVTPTHLPLPASSSSQSSQHTFPFLIHVPFFYVNNPVNPVSAALGCMHWCVAIHWSEGSLPGPHYWRKWFSVQELSVSTAPMLGAGPRESLPDPRWNSNQLDLCRSYAGSHSYWEFMDAMALACPEDVALQQSLPTGPYNLPLFLKYSLSLGGGMCMI